MTEKTHYPNIPVREDVLELTCFQPRGECHVWILAPTFRKASEVPQPWVWFVCRRCNISVYANQQWAEAIEGKVA